MVKVVLISYMHSNKEGGYGKSRLFTPPLCMKCKGATFTIFALIKLCVASKRVALVNSRPCRW